MEQVLAGLPLHVCLIYLDDILVAGRSVEQHTKHLRQVLQRLREAKLKVSPKKCQLFRQEMKFLGHAVSEAGVATDPEKTEAVHSWPLPTTASELKSFLGLCSYYRRFVPSFAQKAAPLYEMANSEGPLKWTTEAEDAFTHLKEALTQAPILGYPIDEATFILDTDASSLAIGGVLSQQQGGDETVIAYFSSSLSRAEKQYCTTRKELLAIVKAIKHFHPYLYGRRFVIRTDHAALQWLLSFRSPEGQVARWIHRLQEYDFDIQHRAGLQHNNADALSRRSCLEQGCRHCEKLESKEANQAEVELESRNATNQEEVRKHTTYISQGTSISPAHRNLREAQLQDEDIRPIVR